MIREVIATGRDAESAIENGCLELGLSRDEVEFEILSLPKKSLFGLKTLPAKVRVYKEMPDIVRTPREAPKPAAPAPQAAPQKQPQQGQSQQRQQQPQPPRESGGRPQQQPPRERRPETREGAGPRREARGPQGENQPSAPRVEIVPDEAMKARVARAADYVQEVLKALGVTELAITPKYYADSVSLQMEGGGLGVIIGRRGETLDALQYLAALVANRGEAEYLRLNIDSGNYREKREQTLEGLARKLATQAVRTGKSTTLEPMNPYERRIIHGAVSQIKGATSSSVGVEPNRRVVIAASGQPKQVTNTARGSAGGERQYPFKSRSDNDRGGGSRGRGGPGRRPSGGSGPSGDRRPSRPPGDRRPDSRRQAPDGPPPTTAYVGGQAQDLSLLTESLHTTLKAPPPPSFRPKETEHAAPAPQAEERAPAIAAPREDFPETAKPELTLTKEEEKAKVQEAPRYGKIEI